MFLKALTIKGFKSFAEPVDLMLEPGITVVVGPNGSGKSNVVDAMAWVLGAQAPSAVRSQKMEDVIFAGTSAKKALGRAEVSLTIDNTDGLLPVEFNEVMITRTLFRNGESDYGINGVSCRLLDIQELLSDSGVGRQQHIIVSQGRIDDVLNARPEERRGIIEEAAGVLKYRKRRERAERRLETTADNLSRLRDLLREVKRQIRPLERQADAARRHGTLVNELHSLKVHLTGRELKALSGQLETGRRVRYELDERDGHITSTLATLDAHILTSEAELSALGASDVADVVSRTSSLSERVKGQRNVVAERLMRLDGELQAAVDDGLVANLEAEAARLAAEIAVASAEIDTLQPEFVNLKESEQRLTTEQLTFDTEWGDTLSPAPSRVAEVRTRIDALTQSSGRDEQELSRLGSQITSFESRRDQAIEARSGAQELIDHNEALRPNLEAGLADTDSECQQREDALSDLHDQQRRADAEASRWQARAEALEQALDAARSRAGADALREADGVLGTLLDLVEIDQGWELAVEAAIGDALLGVVVDSRTNAENALALLDEQELAGGVITLGANPAPVMAGATPGRALRPLVRPVRPDVAPLLDKLLSDVVVAEGGWRQSLGTILDNPAYTFVTKEGDRFGPRGWRLRQAQSGATGAALDEARAQETAANSEAATVTEAVRAATNDLAVHQRHRRQIEEELRHCVAEFERSVLNRDRAMAEVEQVESDRARLVEQRSAVFSRKQDDAGALRQLITELPALENQESEHRSRAEALAHSRTSLEERSREVASKRTELEVRVAAAEERRELLVSRQGETESRLSRLVTEREFARARRVQIEESIAVVSDLDAQLGAKQDLLAEWLAVLRAEQQAQSDAARRVSQDLSARRGERAASEKELAEIRERRTRLEMSDTEYRVKLEALTEAVRRELDTDPDVAMTAPCPEIESDQSPEARARDLERELKIMGAINPLALEEFEELKERYEFLDGQIEDVKSARRDLHKLIRSIDEEIVGVFAAAFADVSSNFGNLFATLFPGGKGGLKLTNADDLLNCGIEIEAKPSGKNVKKLSLLSGGERSLVALAFLFAVFRSRPSPFYVMDEVEAALDDINLSRFLALVEEFRQEAQLIIVSHQKRTMEAADVLYGVSMKPGGSSKVVTERIDEHGIDRLTAPASDLSVLDDESNIGSTDLAG